MTRYPPSVSTSCAASPTSNSSPIAARTSSRLARPVARNEPSLCRVTAGRFGFVVLVGDIADDEFDQVFDRDKPVAAAVFVDHESEVNPRRLHLGEQIERRHRWRRVEDLADDLGGRSAASTRSIFAKFRLAVRAVRLALPALSAGDRRRRAPP